MYVSLAYWIQFFWIDTQKCDYWYFDRNLIEKIFLIIVISPYTNVEYLYMFFVIISISFNEVL